MLFQGIMKTTGFLKDYRFPLCYLWQPSHWLSSLKKVPSMVLFAVMGRFMFLLIPNLKYEWFQGTAIDQHIQYGLANDVYAEGYIATQGALACPEIGVK